MNSFRSVERADRVRDRAPGGRPRRRRAARPGDARLVRGARRDLPHAGQGDLGRLPLLPGAGPAAAPRRRRRGWRRSGPRCRSCRRRGAPATATSLGLSRLRRGGPRRRPGRERRCSRRRWPRRPRSPRRPSRTGSPASTSGCATRPRTPVAVDAGRARRDHRGGRATGRSRARTAARSSRRTPTTGEPRRGDHRGPRLPPDLRRRRARRRSSTRCSRPTRRPSPTTAPARTRRSAFLVGQVMKATRGQANAALAGEAVRARARRRTGGGGLSGWDRSTSSCGSPGSS